MTDRKHSRRSPRDRPRRGAVPGPTEAPRSERIEALERERDEYLDSLQRLAADFDNFRKRVARDQESLVERAHERLDQGAPAGARRPRARAGGGRRARGGQARGGRPARPPVARRTLLRREGLAEIETDGAFDPHVHEALLAQPAEDAEPGSVLQVLQKGYRLGDRVLRPARVVVAE